MAVSRKTPLRIVALLMLIIGVWVSGLLCYRVAATDSYWLDELHTVWTIERPDEASFATAAASGNQSTFYFRIVRVLAGEDADSPLRLRWFSILCSVLTVASLGFFVWDWSHSFYGSALAVWAAGIEPRFVFYGSEARPYALLMLFAVWQFFVFCRLTIRKSDDVEQEITTPVKAKDGLGTLILLLLSIGLVLTHQTGVLLLAAEMIVLLALRQRTRTNVWLVGAAIVVSGLVVFAMQASTYSEVFARRIQWSTLSSVGGLASEFRNSVVFLLVVPLAILYWIVGKGRFRSEQYRLVCLGVVAAGGLLPPILAGVADYFGWAPLGLFRYTLTGAVLIPLFAGLAIACVRQEWLQLVLAASIVFAAIFVPLPESSADGNSNVFVSANHFFIGAINRLDAEHGGSEFRMRYENWPDAVAEIERLDDDRPIFLFANLLEDAQLAELEMPNKAVEIDASLIDYLRFPLTAFSIQNERVVPRPTLSGIAFQAEHIDRLVTAGGCWVLTRSDSGTFERIAGELYEKLGQIDDADMSIRAKFVRLTSDRDKVPEWLTLLCIDWVSQ